MSNVVVSILTLVLGAIVCFAGYRFFRLSLALIGGVAGFVTGSYVNRLIAANIDSAPSPDAQTGNSRNLYPWICNRCICPVHEGSGADICGCLRLLGI